MIILEKSDNRWGKIQLMERFSANFSRCWSVYACIHCSSQDPRTWKYPQNGQWITAPVSKILRAKFSWRAISHFLHVRANCSVEVFCILSFEKRSPKALMKSWLSPFLVTIPLNLLSFLVIILLFSNRPLWHSPHRFPRKVEIVFKTNDENVFLGKVMYFPSTAIVSYWKWIFDVVHFQFQLETNGDSRHHHRMRQVVVGYDRGDGGGRK